MIAVGMLTWGLIFLTPYLMKRPALFVFYWGGCAIFTGLALIVAFLDAMIMRRKSRDEQIALARRAFGDLPEKKEDN